MNMFNRYAQIHVLFRELGKEVNLDPLEVKSFWKRIFNVSSLKDLNDEELQGFVSFLKKNWKDRAIRVLLRRSGISNKATEGIIGITSSRELFETFRTIYNHASN